MIKFIVVIPVKDSKYLDRAINSVKKQNYPVTILVQTEPNVEINRSDCLIYHSDGTNNPRVDGWYNALKYDWDYLINLDVDDELCIPLLRAINESNPTTDLIQYGYNAITKYKTEEHKPKTSNWTELTVNTGFGAATWIRAMSRNLIQNYIIEYYDIKEPYNYYEDIIISSRFPSDVSMSILPIIGYKYYCSSDYMNINLYMYYVRNAIKSIHYVKDLRKLYDSQNGFYKFYYEILVELIDYDKGPIDDLVDLSIIGYKLGDPVTFYRNRMNRDREDLFIKDISYDQFLRLFKLR